MPLTFVKGHAYGNDFLMVPEAAVASVGDVSELARRLCDRHRGIGADGLMLTRETPQGAAMRLLNADGSRAEISGNGLRCVAASVARDRQLEPGAQVVIDTDAGPKPLSLLEVSGTSYRFRAAMGPPDALREETILVDGQPVVAVVLRVGNPQCVVLGPVTHARLESLASRLAVHPFFPEGTNVELAMVESPVQVRMLIWERGVGPTEASGTGACAAAVAAAAFGGASRSVDVISPGGTQHVDWTDVGIFLTGWAEIVAAGGLVE